MNIFCHFNFIIEEMPYECIQGIVWQVCYPDKINDICESVDHYLL